MTQGNDILTPTPAGSALGFSHLMPPLEESSVLTVACRPDDFSASVIARAVEDSDAHLCNLNVTDVRLDDGRITIELRTNRRNAVSTARSLERYGFDVIDAGSGSYEEDAADETLRFRAAELLHMMNI